MTISSPRSSLPVRRWPRGLVTREGTEGYGDSPEAVPAAIRQWILVHVAYYYEHRTSATEGALSPLPFVSALLDPFRTWT